MFLRVIAILVAPVPLAFFFFATTPSDTHTPAAVLGGYYLMAHIFLWPPLVATNYVARRMRLKTTVQIAATMATCSMAMTSVLGIAPDLVLNPAYTWRAALRDAIVVAVASVGSLWLYAAVRSLGWQPSAGAAPNNRWRGP
jgi:hypothetical protein